MVMPVIAVTGRRRSASGVHDGPAALDRLEIDVYFAGYADHIGAAGGLAVHLPSGIDVAAVMDRVDGLVLTGGTDVDPARYGGSPDPAMLPVNPARDELELALLDAALRRELPVLAICRGLQLVNVSRGGTLLAHLSEHSADLRHDVLIEPGSTLAALHGFQGSTGGVISVNSLHHQAVDRLGHDLVVTARAPDGVIEGIELPGTPLIAVQWHPEQLDDAPQPVFGWLVDAAIQRQPA